MLAISYITAHFIFASAKYLFTQNCKAPSGIEIFDGFSQSELKQDADLARRDLAKDAKIARRRAYAFDSLRLYRILLLDGKEMMLFASLIMMLCLRTVMYCAVGAK